MLISSIFNISFSAAATFVIETGNSLTFIGLSVFKVIVSFVLLTQPGMYENV